MAKRRKFLRKMKKRLMFVSGVFVAAFLFMIGTIIYINVTEGDEYEQGVLTQQGYVSTNIPYRRGDIIDTNGITLATTNKVYNLILEPKNILEDEEKKAATISALKQFFSFTDSEINEYLSNEMSYYEVARKKLTYEEIQPFSDFIESEEGEDVTGVYFEEEYKRVYPNNELACHLLGFTVSGNVGMYGIEEGYNDYLNGYNGRRYNYLDANNDMESSVEPAVNGYNIITTIDANIQSSVQKVVDAYMAEEGAKNVSVLVMDPTNCNVLALYNSHQFDPNDAYDLDSLAYQFETPEEFENFKKTATDEEKVNALYKVWRNFAISDVYEPGSTYKVFTISGALEENVISNDDKFFCDGGEEKAGYFIKCHNYDAGGHGEVDVIGAMTGSCNDALMQIAAKEGPTVFDKYQEIFGFGRMTGIDIPGEPTEDSFSTVIYHKDTLNVTELATSSFGQGVCVSMIQLGTAFCSTINGGYYYKPSVVKRIEDENGNVIKNVDKVLVRKTISEEVSALMRDSLYKVVEEGTGKRARIEGYSIGGKTGTAEKVPRDQGKFLLSFIGCAPMESPEVVIYVVVDEPNTDMQQYSKATTEIFKAISEEVFPYMNIYKTNDNFIDENEPITDQPPTSIYEGDVNPDDVAGGEDNPYVPEDTTDASTDDGEGDGTDDGTGDGDDDSSETPDDTSSDTPTDTTDGE